MLYADDLVIIAETLEELRIRYNTWKDSMESKGLRVNLAKTKIMISGVGKGPTFTSGENPCGVCSKGVGTNSILCTNCNHWVHKRCSDVAGRLDRVVDFRCRKCLNPQQAPNDLERKVDIDGNEYEVVDQFCYLGDMLSAGGGAEASSVCRVRSGWKKFRELLPLLTRRVFSHKAKGRLYSACVRSVMTYGSETWPLKEDDISRIARTDMQMIRWMCNVSLRERKSSEELRDRLGIPNIVDVLRRNRLRWFGHVERMNEHNPVKRSRTVVVEGNRTRGRPCKTWGQLIDNDLRKLRLDPGLAYDREAWKRDIR